MKPRVAIGILLLAAFAGSLAWLSRGGADGDGAPGTPGKAGGMSGGPTTCLPCHAEVVAEWQASMHARAFTDPQVRAPDQADDFRKAECLPCHAPAPVFENGIAENTRVLARTLRRADGVDCLSCHATGDGGMAATRPGLTAACRPVLRQQLSTHLVCQACHNQHNTHEEWKVSPAAASGKACADCHMPRLTRQAPEAGGPRPGRSHRFPGGRDEEFATAGFEVTHALEDDGHTLVVQLHNAFAGHNLPTDSRNRALDLVVTLRDARGAPLPPESREKRDPGCEAGTARLRFRNPYRQSGDPSTQLPAGETATLRVPIPREAVSAGIEVAYKLSPWVPDTEAHWRTSEDVPLR